MLMSRKDFFEWYDDILGAKGNPGKAEGLILAYHDAYNSLTKGQLIAYPPPRPPDGNKNYTFYHHFLLVQFTELRNVYWWFIRFLHNCPEEPDTAIPKVARNGRPDFGLDYRQMKMFAVAMRDIDGHEMRDPFRLSPEAIKEECVPFVAAARAMIKLGLVA